MATNSVLNRRTAVGGAGLTLAMASLGRPHRAAAQSVDHSGHPLSGTWLAMANATLPEDPQFPAPSLFAADGTVLLIFPVTQRGPAGVFYGSPVVGTWEPETERRGSFTAVQVMSDAEGNVTGTLTINGHPEVSEDGQTFVDDGSLTHIVLRDASGAILMEVIPTGEPAGPPVTAVRVAVGVSGFPEAPAAVEGTPAS